jgi:hypothetical protein
MDWLQQNANWKFTSNLLDDEIQNTIYIDHIGPRGDVYKKR